jgi:hypothetical protein
MRCLHCGEQLALLKKFTDGEFCTAEHRTVYFETQQKLIIERLSDSNKRFQRFKRPPPKPVPPTPKVELDPPFAPCALGHPCEIYNWAAPARAFQLAFLADDLLIVPPDYKFKGRDIRVVRLTPGLPVSQVQPISAVTPKIPLAGPLPAQTPNPRIPSFSRTTSSRPGGLSRFGTAIQSRAREGVADPRVAGFHPIGSSQQHTESGLSSSLSHTAAQVEPAPLFWTKLFRPRARPAMDCETVRSEQIAPHPVDPVSRVALGMPAATPAPGRKQTLVPAFLDRAIRIRPRQGVADPLVRDYEFIDAGPAAAAPDGWIGPNLPPPAIREPEPVFLGQVFRMRARGPVQWKNDGADGMGTGDAPEPLQSPVRLPRLPGVLASAVAPVFLDRAFRMRPRNGVVDLWVGSYQIISAGATESLASPPALGTLPALIGECRPEPVGRFCRLSPKGPALPAGLASSDRIGQGELEALLSTPATGALPVEVVTNCSPVLVHRMYRMRPRAAMPSEGLPEFERLATGAPSGLSPSVTKYATPDAVIAERELSTSEQPFRIRPRSAVQTKSLAAFEQISTGNRDALISPASKGSLPANIIGERQPVWLDRFFRMRPKSAVSTSSQAPLEQIPAGGPATLLSAARRGSLPANIVGTCEPVWLDRTYKMRPRPAVPAADQAAYERIPTGVPDALLSVPAKNGLPADIIGDREPVWLDRTYKMRPRTAVPAAALARFESVPTGDSIAPVSTVSKCGVPAIASGERTPIWLNRFYSMRPRKAAADEDLALFEQVATGEPGALVPSTSKSVLPAQVISDLAPVWLDRMFKMRPKTAVAAKDLAAFEIVSPGDPDALLSAAFKGGLPVHIVDEPAPVWLDRMFKMRPKTAVAAKDLAVFEEVSTGDADALLSAASKNSLPAEIIGGLSLVWLDRMFKMRPKMAVAAKGLAAFEKVSTGNPNALLSPASKNSLPAGIIGGLSLVWLDRMFKMRPKTAVAGKDLAVFEDVSTGDPDALLSAVSKNSLPADIIGEVAPVWLDRMYKMRPKPAVLAVDLAPYEQILPGGSESLQSHPALGAIPAGLVGAREPVRVTHIYRMRPRNGVQDGRLSVYERLLTGPAESLQSDPELARLARIEAGEASPDFVQRMFRPRPKSGAGIETALTMLQLPTGASELRIPSARLGTLPVSVVSEVIPQWLDKPYRMRPRAGVSCNGFYHRAPVDMEELTDCAHTVPAMPMGPNTQCAPALVQDPFRTPLRNPVNGTGVYTQVATGAPATIRVETVMPKMPAILMRQSRADRQEGPPKRRPPAGPAGPRMRGGMKPLEPVAIVQDPVADEEPVPEPAQMALAPEPVEPWTILENSGPADAMPLDMTEALGAEIPFRGALSNPILDASDVALEIPMPARRLAPAMPGHSSCYRVMQAYQMQPALPWQRPCQIAPRAAAVMTPSIAFVVVPDQQFARKGGLLRRYAERAAQLWVSIPRDWRWAAAGVAVFVGIFLHSTLNQGQDSAELKNMQVASFSDNPLPPLQTAVKKDWNIFQIDLVGRAAVEMHDDFNSGLGAWQGGGDWAKSWDRDSASGVHVGSLALYLPSLALSDYDLDFRGEIAKKALGWVVRAPDLNNYYAVRLEEADSSSLPAIYIVRYAVIGGKEGPRTRVRLALPMGKDAAYHVNMGVREQFFTLSVQGHVVDFWSDDRLKTGGIGFFSGKGEQSRIESVQLTHQYDALGKLCAYLFPRGNPNQELRSSQQ